MNKDENAVNMKEILADYDKTLAFFSQTPAEVWDKISNNTALKIFQKTASSIPAYKDVLRKNKVKIGKMKNMEEFSKLPVIDKYNYIKKYNFNETNLVHPGKNFYSFMLSSGTVDEPTIWPRYYAWEESLPTLFDTYMRMYWQYDKKSTLFINAYSLGCWTAGWTVNVLGRELTQKRNMTLATCGADLDSIVYSIKKLSKFYDQTVIWSYPTFCRTILERLELEKINIRKLNLKLFIAGEHHTMEWKHYINKIISGDESKLTDILEGYGTSDGGMIGLASSITTLVRELAYKNPKFCADLFGRDDVVPSLFQYVPNSYYIEQINGEIVFTTEAATPLVRYNIHDRGGVISFREMEQKLSDHGYDYKKLIKQNKIIAESIWQHPFVYCFGRRDDTIMIAGAKIYPEQIAPALFTGDMGDIHNFKLILSFNEKQKHAFEIALELKSGICYDIEKSKRKSKIYHDLIIKELKSNNSDYSDVVRMEGSSADPIISIYEFGSGIFKEDLGRTKPIMAIKEN